MQVENSKARDDKIFQNVGNFYIQPAQISNGETENTEIYIITIHYYAIGIGQFSAIYSQFDYL